MTEIKKGIFQIGDIPVDRNTPLSVFEENEKFTVDHMDGLTIVDSAPASVDFLGGDFFAEIFYYGKKPERIILYPVLQDYPDPGYPDQAFQRAKWDYCAGLLLRKAGLPDESDETTLRYRFEGGWLFLQMVMDGREAYTGGDIIIEFDL